MNDDRYIRQLQLKEFGPDAQQRLRDASVLVIGAGGLGLPVLQYLNAMGVGTLGIVEQDVVERSNLHRQVLYYERDIGQPKISVVLQKLKDQNPSTNLIAHDTFLVKENALGIIEDYDLVVDATDNFTARYLVNDCCIILKKPFVYGALHGFEGQLSVFNYHGGPSYRCLFPSMPAPNEIPNCNDQGVLGVLPGIIGNMQALEVVKIITGVGEVLSGKLLLFNGLTNSFYKLNVPINIENKKIKDLADKYEPLYCDPSWEVSAEELQTILTKDMELQIIDVRSEKEFGEYHLSGSINIPLPELEQRMEEISSESTVYILCQSGLRSMQALHWLKEKGYQNPVYHLAGGLNQYNLLSA